MANPIIRAGPFASASDSFLDEPSSPIFNILPVNCAKDTTSTRWPWRYRFYIFDSGAGVIDLEYKTGLPITVSEPDRGAITTISTDWRYQSAVPFQLQFDYNLTADSRHSISFTVFIDGEGVVFRDSSFSNTDPGSIGGSVVLDFPASVVPRLVEVFARLDVLGTALAEYTVSDPDAA